MRLVDFYRTQLRVLWEWKGGRWALVRRFIVTSVLAAISFLATGWVLPGITVDGFSAALRAVIAIAIFNAVIRSLVLAVMSPFSRLLTGVLVLIFQVVAFLVVAQQVPGV